MTYGRDESPRDAKFDDGEEYMHDEFAENPLDSVDDQRPSPWVSLILNSQPETHRYHASSPSQELEAQFEKEVLDYNMARSAYINAAAMVGDSRDHWKIKASGITKLFQTYEKKRDALFTKATKKRKGESNEERLLRAQALRTELFANDLKKLSELGSYDFMDRAYAKESAREARVEKEVPVVAPVEVVPAQPEPETEDTQDTALSTFEAVLADSPLSDFEGLDARVVERFHETRTAYFTAFLAHYTKKEGPADKKLERLRAAYAANMGDVAFAIRDARMHGEDGPNASWKESLIDTLIVGEGERLNMLRAAASSERQKVVAEKAQKKKPWLRRALLGLMAGVALGEGSSVDVEPKFRYEDTDDAERKKETADAAGPETEVDSEGMTPVLEDIDASGKGINQMVLDMLKQMQEKDPAHAAELIEEGETPIQAAERIAKESGAWDVSQNLSVTVGEGDKLVADGGDLIYVTVDGDERQMTKDGETVRAWKNLQTP